MNSLRSIPFSPPDISQREIDAVVEVLKSGWITTGPVTKQFERDLAAYCGNHRAVCLNSATAGLELVLRLLEVGPGDEVITSAYTYAATANVIRHVGATPVFVDVKPNEFNIDPEAVGRAITVKTKVVIPIDFAGWPCDYIELKDQLDRKAKLYKAKKGTLQESFDRPVILADAAHSFGSIYHEKKASTCADFTVFSFHAVKNLTTGEGGAVLFDDIGSISSDEIYRKIMLLALHGQSKDALQKTQAGSWAYTIDLPGYKCNMTDMAAAIGRIQLARYDSEIMPHRERIFRAYSELLGRSSKIILPPFSEDRNKKGSFHPFPVRIKDCDEKRRADIIRQMAEKNISLNVHFIPVVSHPAYEDFKELRSQLIHTYKMYENEISLPIYSTLRLEDVTYLCDHFLSVLNG